MIRIISGTHKGRRIRAPKRLPVRPTTDRAKEALFNILAAEVDWSESRVLDLYAGTGNISYECASRGCADITSVDADPGCISFIRETARELEMGINPVKASSEAYLRGSPGAFDFIFADPPYARDAEELERLAGLVFQKELLAQGGLLVIEHGKETSLERLPNFDRARRYGGSVFSFFREG